MKKLIFLTLVALAIFSFVPSIASAQTNSEKIDKIDFVLFHSHTCPHCKDEIKFIDEKLIPKYSDYVDFSEFEIGEPENQELMEQYGYRYKVDVRGVPLTFIDDNAITGFGNEKTTGKQIIDIIDSKLIEKGLIEEPELEPVSEDVINIPLLGEVDLKNASLPVLTVIIGLIDGFNPCAMWALLFLITLLLGMEDKRRMWLLGSLFILSSGIVYFFFMAAWLQFLTFIGMIFVVRIIIGIVAVGVGAFNLRDYWKHRKADGVVCKVSGKETTKKTFEKIKNIVYKKSIWWAILGIILLGFSVNLVELACSAGFPAIFTQILSISDLPVWKRYLYMAGYIFFYMLDDMFVFAIAMLTLKSKVFGSKYAKYTNLVGGVLIFILGLLLIFKPEWLMFS
jgi:hypothetical protein